MKNSYKVALLVALGLAGAQAAFASPGNDLIIDINNNDNAGTSEFDANLGTLATLAGEANTPISLSGFSASALGGGAGNLLVGVYGGKNGNLGNTGNNVITTTLDDGAGTPTVAGSSAPGVTPAYAAIGSAGGISVLTSGTTSLGTAGSWNQVVSQNEMTAGAAANSFVSYLGGANPLQVAAPSSTVVLDLWKDTVTSGNNVSGWVYEGDLTVNLTTDTVTYDAVSVPEPTTYGLLAGFGLLVLGLRKQFSRKNA